MRQTLGKVLSNRVILVLLVAEFFTGFIRQGLLSKINPFFSAVYSIKPGAPLLVWLGVAQLVGGIAGGLIAGIMSDRLFRSRRPPVAAIFYVLAGVALLVIAQTSTPQGSVVAIGFAIPWIMGVHGMLSGTAAADFGGHKAAATATGLLDGAQYVAGGTAPLAVAMVIERQGWGGWMVPLVPAAAIGASLMLLIWNAKPGKNPH
jgi:OPA family glycerol-3-phosphate transporter-like MFS transporter